MARDWIVELHCEGHGFMTHAGGYETEAKAKAAAARAFKSESHVRRVRVVHEGQLGPIAIHEVTFRPGERARWQPHPGNL